MTTTTIRLPDERVREIIEALDVLEGNPLIGRPVANCKPDRARTEKSHHRGSRHSGDRCRFQNAESTIDAEGVVDLRAGVPQVLH